MIKDNEELYDNIEMLIKKFNDLGIKNIAIELEEAMSISSIATEILGELKNVITKALISTRTTDDIKKQLHDVNNYLNRVLKV